MEPKRIPSLDGLRGISILLVLFHHLRGTRGFLPMESERWTGPLGPLGVQVFFLISGFLITSLLRDETRKTGRISVPQFYWRRAFRILPASFVFFAAVLGAASLGLVTLSGRDAFHLLTYTVNYFPSSAWQVGHIWSLSVEEHFYLAWPFVLWLFGWRAGTWFAASILLATPLLRYWNIAQGNFGIPSQTHLVADSIATGCLLSVLRPWLHEQGWYRRLLASPLASLAPVIALLANAYPYGRVHWLVLVTVINLSVALTIDHTVSHPETLFGRLLNTRSMAFVGTISYSLYLWQQPFLDRTSAWWVAAFPQNLIAASVAALASFYLVESPCLRLRKSIEDRRRFATVRFEFPAEPRPSVRHIVGE